MGTETLRECLQDILKAHGLEIRLVSINATFTGIDGGIEERLHRGIWTVLKGLGSSLKGSPTSARVKKCR